MSWLFSGKKDKKKEAQMYEVRIADPRAGVRVEGGQKTIPCQIDRRPDDVCYFMDENNTRYYLFGFAVKKFKKEQMIKDIVKGCFKREDRAFIKRAFVMFKEQMENGGGSRVDSLKNAILKGNVDPVILAEKIMYTAVPDDIIINSKGKVPVLVRKTDSGKAVSISGEILDVNRI